MAKEKRPGARPGGAGAGGARGDVGGSALEVAPASSVTTPLGGKRTPPPGARPPSSAGAGRRPAKGRDVDDRPIGGDCAAPAPASGGPPKRGKKVKRRAPAAPEREASEPGSLPAPRGPGGGRAAAPEKKRRRASAAAAAAAGADARAESGKGADGGAVGSAVGSGGGGASSSTASGTGKKNTFVPDVGSYTFEPDPDDHCETDIRAYQNLRPALLLLERAIYGTNKGELKLWDPYFCNGAVKRNLAKLGFPKCHNANEDFYAVAASGRLPPHDVLVTSPPYSVDHIERCMRHCAASGKAWCVLLPNWVHKKDYYQELLRTTPALVTAPPQYLGPAGRSYNYWFPTKASQRPGHIGQDGSTTPYATSWAIHVPTKALAGGTAALFKGLEAEQKRCGGEWVIARTVKGLKWCAKKLEEKRRAKEAKKASKRSQAKRGGGGGTGGGGGGIGEEDEDDSEDGPGASGLPRPASRPAAPGRRGAGAAGPSKAAASLGAGAGAGALRGAGGAAGAGKARVKKKMKKSKRL